MDSFWNYNDGLIRNVKHNHFLLYIWFHESHFIRTFWIFYIRFINSSWKLIDIFYYFVMHWQLKMNKFYAKTTKYAILKLVLRIIRLTDNRRKRYFSDRCNILSTIYRNMFVCVRMNMYHSKERKEFSMLLCLARTAAHAHLLDTYK